MFERDYVVQTHPAHEVIAHGNLQAAGFTSYLPTVIYEGRTGRLREKRYTTVEPLFPGYLFVVFDIAIGTWREINALRGVKRILGVNPEAPTPLPIGALSDLKARFAAGEFVKRPNVHTISAGDQVTVTRGAFSGHAGVCTVSRGERIRVMLSRLWGSVEVDMPAACAARAEA